MANDRPNWAGLFDIASTQDGLFTTRQAAEVGYSTRLLVHHVRGGVFVRVLHGVYRLVYFPAAEYEGLTIAWLWSGFEGCISHESALSLHRLSDVLPSQVHLTVPQSWRHRRVTPPEGVVLHYADLQPLEKAWYGAVPITKPERTLVDCAIDHLSPELLRQAVDQAISRGLVDMSALAVVQSALAPFGGLAA